MTPRGRGRGAAPPAASGEDRATRDALNYALGNLGGRWKSWMTPLSGQHQPTTMPNLIRHPPARKPSGPSNHAEAPAQARQALGAEPIHGQPLSSSTSPQLANVLSHPSSGRQLPSTDGVLPSPAPSEDASIENVPIPTSGASGTRGYPSPRNAFADGVPQTAAAPKRPLSSTGRTTPSNKRAHQSTSSRPRPIPPPLDTQNADIAHWQMAQPLSGARTRAAGMSLDYALLNAPHATTHPPFQQDLTPYIPDQSHILAQNGPVSYQHQAPSGPPAPLRQPSLPHQAIVPRNSNMLAWPRNLTQIQGKCLQRLSNAKMTLRLHDGLESQRIKALELAAADWDWDYLMTHLFFCLLTLDRGALPEAVRLSMLVPATEAFLVEILDANYNLMPDVKHLFTTFPMTIQQLQECNPQQLNKDLSQFLFLMRRAGSYQALKQACDERGAPPSVHEMVHEMGITSKQLQQMVFTANMRRLWRNWGLEQDNIELRSQFETRAMPWLFKMQNSFYNRLRPGPQQEQDSQRERDAEIHALVPGFRALRDYHTNQAIQGIPTAVERPVLENRIPNRLPPHSPQSLGSTFEHGSHQSSTARQSVTSDLGIPHGHNGHFPLPQQLVLSSNASNSTQPTVRRGRGRPRGSSRTATLMTHPRDQLPVQHHPEHRLQSNPSLYRPPDLQPQPQHHSQPRPQVQSQRPQLQNQPPFVPQSVSKPKLVFPPRHQLAQHQRIPNPVRFGLHQAHLRDAALKHEAGEPLYLYVQSLLREPQRLTDAGHMIERWTFTLTPEQFARIPRDIPGSIGSPPSRIVDEKSILLRLRCAQWTAAKSPDEHDWATSKTTWIPYSFFRLNGKNLELKKKLHYGNDLPIDLTHMVREGENTLDISILRKPNDTQYREYLLAIEILGVQTHNNLLNNILANNRISAATTQQRIKEKLTPTIRDEDDDITLLNKNLTVQLTDPFLGGGMPTTPARSKACDHFQCFELSIFLETRNKDGDCTVADHWKCPICSGDARPQHLIIDGFIENVRDKLISQGLQNTRAIVVSEDGSWKPKAEVLEGVADPDDDDAPAGLSARGKKPAPPVVDVIELGDSDDD